MTSRQRDNDQSPDDPNKAPSIFRKMSEKNGPNGQPNPAGRM